MSAGPQIQTKYKQSGPLNFLRNSFYTYVSIGAGSCWWMAASNLLQTILKKSKVYKFIFFQDGTWRQVAMSRCRWLQSVAATCSHLLKQPLASTCSHLQPLAASGCKWLQVAASGDCFSKIKMMHVCSQRHCIEICCRDLAKRSLTEILPTELL